MSLKDATIAVPATAPRNLHKDNDTNIAFQHLTDTTINPLLAAVQQMQAQIAALQGKK